MLFYYFQNFTLELLNFLPDIFIFVFGAAIGSFLNVVIHRVPREESIVLPNSACPTCGEPIHFYDNIPILSWLLLGGKCRRCRAGISPRYLLVELLTGILFVAAFRHDGFDLPLPFDLAFIAALVALIFIDAEHMILPDVINYPGLILAFVLRLLLPLVSQTPVFDDLQHSPLVNFHEIPVWLLSLFGGVLGAAVGGGSLWLLGWIWEKLRGVEAMGFGDVKMMLMVGAFLGWRLTLLTLFLAALTGALAGILIAVARGERDLSGRIPFGIFLGIGSLTAYFCGDRLIAWYLLNFVPQ